MCAVGLLVLVGCEDSRPAFAGGGAVPVGDDDAQAQPEDKAGQPEDKAGQGAGAETENAAETETENAAENAAETESETEVETGSAGGPAPVNEDGRPTSCMDPAPDDPPYELTVRVDLYEVDADTLEGLREQMSMRSPTAMAARVDWRVTWDFDWIACDGSGLEVALEIDYSLPQWNQPDPVDPRVVEGWTGFIDALWCHEYGHAQFGISVAEEAHLALSELPAPGSCQELSEAANEVLIEIFEVYRAEEIAYDEETDHGASMGARLPAE